MTPPPEPTIHRCGCSICHAGSDPAIIQRHSHMKVRLRRRTEPQQRWSVGFLAQQPDRHGDRQLVRMTGLARNPIRRGRRELAAG